MKYFSLLFIDILIIYASIILGFWILNEADFLMNYQNNFNAFLSIALFIAPLYVIISYIFGMIKLQRKSIAEIIYTVSIVSIALTISIAALAFFSRYIAEAYPRSVIIVGGLLYFILLTIWRIFVQKVYFTRHGIKDVIIIGKNNHSLIQNIRLKHHQLYNITGIYTGEEDNIERIIYSNNYIFLLDDVHEKTRSKVLEYNNDHKIVSVFIMPKVQDLSIMNAVLYPFGDIPIHNIKKLRLSDEESFAKRLIDLFLATIGIIIFSPIMLLIAIIIAIGGGNIIYSQERLTKNRKSFTIYKFRTMKVDAEKNIGPAKSTNNDPRITKIGAVLRMTRLDELPQLFNIFIGDMSFVGPRPERPFFVEQIENELPEFKYRLHVKAGLTGLAQIMGKYNTDASKKLFYDLHYISHYSILRDFIIMIQTIKVIFWKENVEGYDSYQ